MNFIFKHLKDKFYQDGSQRISIRDRIFREVIGNFLIHREYLSGFPAKLIIDKNQLYTENWNKPHGNGNINPSNFLPYPKNPMIARFFKEIGWVDELGSGVRNVYKYTSIYTPKAKPSFIEEDVFKTIIPLISGRLKSSEKSSEKGSEKSSEKSSEKILELIQENKNITISKLSISLNISTRAIEKQLSNLKTSGKLLRIGANKGGYWKIK
jgi:ATP-dependent DNA helicase RecG